MRHKVENLLRSMKRTTTTMITKTMIRIGAATASKMFCPWVGVDVSTANEIVVITLCVKQNKGQ